MRNILVCIKRTKQERGTHDEDRFTRSIKSYISTNLIIRSICIMQHILKQTCHLINWYTFQVLLDQISKLFKKTFFHLENVIFRCVFFTLRGRGSDFVNGGL